MHEGIGLAVIALDEAEAFHRVEELDRAGRLLPGELPLRAAAATIAVALPRGAAILDRHRLAVDLEIGRRNAPTAIDQREVERLAFAKAGQPRLLAPGDRSEDGRVGKEGGSTCRTRGWP